MYITSSQMTQVTEQQIADIRHEFKLDRPMPVQYLLWINDMAHGDLGSSLVMRTSVSSELVRRIPITMYLSFLSLLLTVIVGIPLGIIAAVRRGSWIDTTATFIANFGITVPIFWLAILMIYFIGLDLGWLPLQGYTSPLKNIWLSVKQTIMPIFCLSIMGIGSIARQCRSSMLEVIHQDYIRTAWSKGLKEHSILLKHALKNSLIPVVTLLGMTVRNLVGGSVIIETVFNIPGMGRFAVTGLLNQDYAVVEAVILITAVIVAIANLAVDLSYGWLDPRLRLS
jgi:peptide/nickel transport system permease protein